MDRKTFSLVPFPTANVVGDLFSGAVENEDLASSKGWATRRRCLPCDSGMVIEVVEAAERLKVLLQERSDKE